MEACKTPNYCWRKQSCITRDVEKKTVIVCKSWHTSPDSHQVVKPIPTQCRWCTSIKAFSEAARDSSTDLRVAVDSSWFSSFVGIFHWKKSSFDGVRSSLLSLKFGNFDVISNKLYISHLSLATVNPEKPDCHGPKDLTVSSPCNTTHPWILWIQRGDRNMHGHWLAGWLSVPHLCWLTPVSNLMTTYRSDRWYNFTMFKDKKRYVLSIYWSYLFLHCLLEMETHSMHAGETERNL